MCYRSNLCLSSLVIDCRMIITDLIPDIKEHHHNSPHIHLNLPPPQINAIYIIFMSSAQGQHIKANCAIIWENGDYAIDIETDDWVNYTAVVNSS